jgi:hypothetical protein
MSGDRSCSESLMNNQYFDYFDSAQQKSRLTHEGLIRSKATKGNADTTSEDRYK